ncbi:MupG family TIM beta-alpha barrel fold protein [Entomospira culicis]|uniref:DUF871 domain-containing protein n=1 Tax=Entomospira culicis TaxID=2719989 RepID=A0A968GEB4_9SPIO|nr:MupG family TIM beta-alpha barrel fold protein [Entomospira culicis]NIZ18481.1 DUF871 domain-containing protein [Entomospira culicis]NIZ68697.1 DUF871 domain-containing protein [Entomospira culicis]WDI37296.1 MupG family TIM beta-alpha barrel fold protein [Entomospira culicis]WDI38925.1 MupG family TIM beta-alpha barrel fold protein [Entomospira culicis]
MLGVSLFPGLDIAWAEYARYLDSAKALGFGLVFSSLHIPEADERRLAREVDLMIAHCQKLGLKLVIDTSKEYFDRYDWATMPLHALRLDFGFSDEEIVALSHQLSCKISLNASVISQENWQNLVRLGLNVAHVEVCHNYYPREDTGISAELLAQRNHFFHEMGFSTMAFVASHYRPRAPLYAGLPTLEQHRNLLPAVAMQHLWQLGTEHVIIGDAMASVAELEQCSLLSPRRLTLFVTPQADLQPSEVALLQAEHTNRTDMGECVVRSQESRLLMKHLLPIEARSPQTRAPYTVAVDNQAYPRYHGELQIVAFSRPADERVNVIADASPSAILIDGMRGGEPFSFVRM